MDKDVIFPTGIRVFAPHENAPEFIKGALVIESLKFAAWLGQQPEGNVRLDIKQSRKGSWYLQVNTWKADTSKQSKGGGGNPAREPADFDDDVPFVTNAGML